MARRILANRVMIDRSLFSVKALFVERPKGHAKVPENIGVGLDDGKRLEISFSAPLGAFHLLVLLALVAEAQRTRQWQTPDGPEPIDLKLREMMKLDGKSAYGHSLKVSLSYYAFAGHMGREYSQKFKLRLEEALADLGGAYFVWRGEKGELVDAYSLLSHISPAPDSGAAALVISLSPALSEVVNKGARPYTRISMAEARGLECPATVILHAWLSSIVSPGASQNIYLHTILDGVVWENNAPRGSALYRKRKQLLLSKLLPDLQNVGWQCEYDKKKDQIVFTRPAIE